MLPILEQQIGNEIVPDRANFQRYLAELVGLIWILPDIPPGDMAYIIQEAKGPVQLKLPGRTDTLGQTGIGYGTSGEEALLILYAGSLLEEMFAIAEERTAAKAST
jgi:hypothetical protein